jgi:hypothetical protein
MGKNKHNYILGTDTNFLIVTSSAANTHHMMNKKLLFGSDRRHEGHKRVGTPKRRDLEDGTLIVLVLKHRINQPLLLLGPL